jgi:Na+/H+ antiporter NhaD/arsenite permease-like protein
MNISDPALIQSQIAAPLLWSLALGACLGGNGTLVGASANVVIAQVANRNNCPITFGGFTRYGFPFMLVSLMISSLYVYFRYFAGHSF